MNGLILPMLMEDGEWKVDLPGWRFMENPNADNPGGRQPGDRQPGDEQPGEERKEE